MENVLSLVRRFTVLVESQLYLKIKHLSITSRIWDTNEGHRCIFNVEYLFIQRLNEIIINVDPTIRTQEWIRKFVS